MLVSNLYGESIWNSLQRRCLFSGWVVVVVVISLVVIRCFSLFRFRCRSDIQGEVCELTKNVKTKQERLKSALYLRLKKRKVCPIICPRRFFKKKSENSFKTKGFLQCSIRLGNHFFFGTSWILTSILEK